MVLLPFSSRQFTAAPRRRLCVVLASSGAGDPVGLVAANLTFKRLTADAAEWCGKEPISHRIQLTVPVAASC